MKVGILGLPGTGKTTLFNLLTGQSVDTTPFSSGKKAANLGSVKVPDERIDRLVELYEPGKITLTEIQFVDLAGLPRADEGGREGIDELIPFLRDADALAVVLRDFESDQVPAAKGKVDGALELADVRADLILADLGITENRLDRLAKEKRSGDKEKIREYELFERIRDCLEEEKMLYDVELTADEEKLIIGYGLLTRKRFILLRNFGEGADAAIPPSLAGQAEAMNAPIVSMNVLLEQEVMELPVEERAEFCETLGIEGGARDRFIRAAYEALDLISFFTAGPKEVRSWTVERGASARRAAGKIHTDMERGFIRAEVIPFETLSELGSEKAVKEKGKMRLEGKGYIVADGDVMVIRFSV